FIPQLDFQFEFCFFYMLYGLQLPEGGDFEALHCQPSTNFDRSKKLDLTTEPPLLGRCCYVLPFFLLVVLSVINVAS
ncbi:MAG: hypothetical protein LAT51_13360, partial [Flavobacteriaceae bacterium]|nr:hypothetical protein [Flavobacteriaceae bacterium]